MPRLFASIRLRACYPVQRFQKALPWSLVARRGSFRVGAAGRSSFHGRLAWTDRDDRGGAALDDGFVAAARVKGAIGHHRADRFVCSDLAE